MRGVRHAETGVDTSDNICIEEKSNSAWERSWNRHRREEALAVSEG